MKKIISIALILCVLFGLCAGCLSAKPYAKGKLTSTGFESEFIGVRYTLPEGFTLATETEMRDMMGTGAAYFDLDKDLVDYAEMMTVYEMIALLPGGYPNVIVMVEKLPLVSRNISVEQYMDILKEQLQDVGVMSYTFSEGYADVEMAGKTYKQFTATTSVYGFALVQGYICEKIGDRIIAFITTCEQGSEDVLAALMAGFSEY
ncbi:MAG: hypothetical protein FWF10_08530 [Clostridiales bacterium]|nr:hypothetical protein [Clostridiales bacterium]